jgi:dipeptidyl aminopeptidase/acylaminoacyl peptidase
MSRAAPPRLPAPRGGTHFRSNPPKGRGRCVAGIPMLRPLFLTTLAWAASAAAGDTPRALAPIPAEDLFRATPLGHAALSPDGRHLGTIISDEKDMKNLIILDTGTFKPTGLRGAGAFEISTFHWLGNDRVVFNVLKEKLYSWGLYTGDISRLDQFTPINQFDGTEIIGVPRSRPGDVLVWIRQSARDDGRPGPLVELDARRTLDPFDARNNYAVVRDYYPPKVGAVMNYRADQEGDLSLCVTWLDGSAHLFQFVRATSGWREVDVGKGVRWMQVDTDNRYLWVVTHSKEKGYKLRRMEIATGHMEEPVLTDPLYDLSSGKLHFSASGLAGIVYMQRRPRAVWFDKAYGEAQAAMDAHRPETDNILMEADAAEQKFLFLLTGPLHPGSYELLDMRSRHLDILADEAPWLKGRALCPVQSISYTARDGLRLEGYMAMPPGASKEHPVPLVVLAHGGPWVRDTNEFNPEVQFLASRGYAVLQPNYRGSSGYSPEISRAPAYDYRRMCDDVTDATRAILTSGLVDPNRIAIMGASFGGYLAVSGVTFENGLYRCAVTVCGVFDWERFIKSKSDVARPGEYEFLTDEVGKPGRDNNYLERISPLEHADQIHVPVLIAHGTEDLVVDVEQSKRLAKELKRRGVPYETFYRAVEGHGFYDYKDRVDFYRRVEAFLAKNLGGATLTPVN